MTRSLMSYLPYVLRDYTEIQAILVGQQPELDQVWEAAESLLENPVHRFRRGPGPGALGENFRHHTQRHRFFRRPSFQDFGPLE